jgi:hypothetical protein
MTKILLSALVLLLASPVFACKPTSLANCEKYNFKVNEDQYNDLLKLVKSYQGILTKSIKRPLNASSCFNNHFAVHFGEVFKTSLKEHKGKTCLAQVEQVKGQINRLIDRESPELKTISNTSDKKHLKRESKKVKIAMICLP